MANGGSSPLSQMVIPTEMDVSKLFDDPPMAPAHIALPPGAPPGVAPPSKAPAANFLDRPTAGSVEKEVDEDEENRIPRIRLTPIFEGKHHLTHQNRCQMGSR